MDFIALGLCGGQTLYNLSPKASLRGVRGRHYQEVPPYRTWQRMLAVLFLFEIARVATKYVKCATEYKVEFELWINFDWNRPWGDSLGFRGLENTAGLEPGQTGGDNTSTNALEGRILWVTSFSTLLVERKQEQNLSILCCGKTVNAGYSYSRKAPMAPSGGGKRFCIK